MIRHDGAVVERNVSIIPSSSGHTYTPSLPSKAAAVIPDPKSFFFNKVGQ